ncbi:SAM-dependent DNA methyltransferase OS=Stutzerimonas stutzeri OX=316 GN=G7024_23860 PE=4 SV=1 [Stutzerimonas stutzeri]
MDLSDEQIARDRQSCDEAFRGRPELERILATTDFGYRRITVERPLRLRFSVTPEKLVAYENAKGADQAEAFAGVQGEFDNLPAFLKAAGIKKLGKGALKAALACFGERDANAQSVLDDKGNLQADSDLREFENVPLSQNIDDYFAREVLPHVPDAWIDTGKTDEKDGLVGIVGYEINFNRYFYVYQPPRPLAEIDADLKAVEAEIAALLGEVTA